jgi:hypothetical protein
MREVCASCLTRNASLTGAGVVRSPLSGTRKVVDVIFLTPTATPMWWRRASI